MGGSPSPPKPPDAAKSFEQGLTTYLKYLPEMLQQEEAYRQQYDPQRVKSMLGLQARYGPAQTQLQLDRLRQTDPWGQAIRSQQGSQIYSDLRSGYDLPAGYKQELEQQIRGSQVARGNTLGRGAGAAEALYKGKAALDLYQQHLENAGKFASQPSPTQQLLAVPGVGVDRGNAYVNPNAGYQGQQFAAGNYQNLLAQYQLSGAGGPSPWAGAATGAASGALTGASAGPWGAVIGGLVGGAAGYFSTARLKNNIVYDGEENGHSMFHFNYIGDKQRWRGVISEFVKLIIPEAVSEDVEGYETVNYELLGLRMQPLTPDERISVNEFFFSHFNEPRQ